MDANIHGVPAQPAAFDSTVRTDYLLFDKYMERLDRDLHRFWWSLIFNHFPWPNAQPASLRFSFSTADRSFVACLTNLGFARVSFPLIFVGPFQWRPRKLWSVRLAAARTTRLSSSHRRASRKCFPSFAAPRTAHCPGGRSLLALRAHKAHAQIIYKGPRANVFGTQSRLAHM